jgi:hypothetical protein
MVIDIERNVKIMYMSMDSDARGCHTYLLHEVLNELGCEELLNGDKLPTTSGKELKTTTSSAEKGGYKMITYKKNTVSDETITTAGLFRSVIFNSNDQLVCFAPPKAMTYEKFKENHHLHLVNVEEFIDGTMINMFWDKIIDTEYGDDSGIIGDGWRITTRKNIGADNRFYRYSNNCTQRKFGVLFRETFEKTGVNVEKLDKSYCYSFVMRHPENRVVSYVKEPELYLTDAFLLENPSDAHYKVTAAYHSSCRGMPAFLNSNVKFPRSFKVDNYDQLEQMVDGHSPDGSLTKGYMLHCKQTGSRTKIVPEEYNFVKELRGNFADLRFLFLTLHRQGRVHEYLHYYPENYPLFAEYTHLLNDYTHCMFMLYRDCFISKTKPLAEYPANYRTHMYKLHGIYKQYYQPIRMGIRYSDVNDYVNDIDIPLLFNTMFVAK